MEGKTNPQIEFEKGLLATIHDYVVNYPDEITHISKNLMDHITQDLLSDFKFEVTYAKKSSLGGYLGEHTIYCDGKKVVELIEESESKGTAVEVRANPYRTKPSDMRLPIMNREPTLGDDFPKSFMQLYQDWKDRSNQSI